MIRSLKTLGALVCIGLANRMMDTSNFFMYIGNDCLLPLAQWLVGQEED